MSETTVERRRPTRGDTAGIIVFMLAGAVIAVWSVVAAVLRIIELLPNRDVAVPAVFTDTVAQAPIGPGGANVPVVLDTAIVTAPSLPTASLVALIIQPILGAIAVTTVIVCLLLLSRSILVGRVFSRTNTVLVSVAGFAALGGAAAVPFFGNMGANGAFAVISGRTFENVLMSVDLFPFILLAFVAALTTTVFSVGERLQRDTEGLV